MDRVFKTVLVDWVDAITSAEPGWVAYEDAIKEAETPPPLMKTIGFVLNDNEEYIALTDSVGDNEFGQVTKIPRSMIKKLIYLKGETDEEIIDSFDI